MMKYKYAYVKDGKVTSIRPTMNEIPQEMWIKKGLLPCELNLVSVPVGQESDVVEGFEILSDKVIETRIQRIYIPTLDEARLNKIKMFRQYTSNEIYETYPLYKQVNAYALMYGEEFLASMVSFISEKRFKFHGKETEVDGCITMEELETVTW